MKKGDIYVTITNDGIRKPIPKRTKIIIAEDFQKQTGNLLFPKIFLVIKKRSPRIRK